MPKPTDIRVIATRLFFLPIKARVPLKFGTETLSEVTCARVRVTISDPTGRRAEGWGETPLSVQWVWPSRLSYANRLDQLRQFCVALAEAWPKFGESGHPIEIGSDFLDHALPGLLEKARALHPGTEPMPWLAALVCNSAFDLAIHDAFGQLLQRDTYHLYGPEFLSRDLGDFLAPADGAKVSFKGQFPSQYLRAEPPAELVAWHLVGGLDLLETSELTGDEPNDDYPVLLREWIRRDGLKCLKIKLRGNDAAWDYDRIVRVGNIATTEGVDWLTADFNCTVTDPAYVNDLLDRLRDERPRLYGMTLYVEQPFPYELERDRIDAHSVAARKPLFLDESAHDWRHTRLGRELGWTGVALKTCKTQTGALLTCCWAKAHGMTLMVQDLSNPMLAQIPHVRLAGAVGTIMGVETNSMQFYPEASGPEAEIHPGLYHRRNGRLHLRTLRGPGFGARLDEIHRELPPVAAEFSS
jgi:L-alanine-DL-glutamate epimerase-like enolase superfamily enzyme